MKVVKKVFKNKTYTNKNKKKCFSSMYVLVLDNGKEVAVKPIFDEGYTQLDLLAEVKVFGDKNEKN